MPYSFKGKNIAVLGLSTEGIETVKFLKNTGSEITVFDQKSPDRLSPEARELLTDADIKINYRNDGLLTLPEFDIIFRTPGMPLWHPMIEKASRKGAVVTSLTKLFFDLCPCPIIGITGTKGKGTTTTLIGNILKKSGKEVFVGGNIGHPLLNDLPRIGKDSLVVLELSSFQLEDLDKSPHIAVILNITVDHLASSSLESPNYHHSREEYLLAKKNLVKYQNGKDYAVINADYASSMDFAAALRSNIWTFSRKGNVKQGAFVKSGEIILAGREGESFICRTGEILLRGEHNLENITAAITASYLAGADLASIKEAVKEFKGLEHRLELVRVVKNVGYYNDSFATTPETTIAAIRSFSEPLVLIAGGSDKGSDYRELGKEILQSNVKVLILIGLMADNIEKAVLREGAFNGKIIKGLKIMPEIIKAASSEAKAGDVVLLSPACASFDLFKNYKDRGNQFKDEVKKIPA